MTDPRATFSVRSGAYAEARPQYPTQLYSWILEQTAGRERAWDCACGNGQAARGLAPHFREVFASDVSPEQIAHAIQAPNVIYRVEPVEATSFADESFDLVVVAQALHWFDFRRYWREVRRVARPGAFFCGWGYSWPSTSVEAEDAWIKPVRRLLEPFWAPNNRIIWNGYRPENVEFPFEPVHAPPVAIEVNWLPRALIAFVQTWSAYKLAAADPAVAPALEVLVSEALAALPAEVPLEISIPLAVIAGRI